MEKKLFEQIVLEIKKNRALKDGYSEEEFKQREMWAALKKHHNPCYQDIINKIHKRAP